MTEIKIAIPLHGKMAARAFHQPSFRRRLTESGFAPLYFLSPVYFRAFDFDPEKYFELQVESYDAQYEKHFLLQQLRMLRRFVVVTETTDMRFREVIESKLFDATLFGMSAQMTFVGATRRLPAMGRLLAELETRLYPTHEHEKQFKERNVSCVLTPGMGNYGFWNEGAFAREAQRIGLPTFAAITNYDNIVNMGYRGFTPTCLAVWSEQMADEAMKLHRYPAAKLEITGPVQYDRFMTPLPQSREEFLRSLNLDPLKKTILFAGGVNINHYFDIYRAFVEQKQRVWREPFNLIVRPYPHPKLTNAPAWTVLQNLFQQAGAYISNSGAVDANADRSAEFRVDLAFDETPDELNYLLRYSDVMVNYFSTIGLEAAICDLPTIHVGFDSYAFGLRFSVTTSFLQRQTHNRRPLRLAAARVAKNEKELFDALNAYLGDRTLDSEARRRYAESECGALDGQAAVRLTNMIQSRL
ncbi:MAG: hypothetical protein LC099_09080 [Anaerolineales bacterium]|nr:hypothetical protein [Anaerolineales bacterium]